MNVAYIPVRGGSKSIPLKNIKTIAGKPLVYWTVKATCECDLIDKVIVCTDSAAISSVVSSFGFPKVEIIGRSVESATDTASTELGMLEFAHARNFTNIALVQATSPLVTSTDFKNGFDMLSRKGVDSVLTVVRQKRFLWATSGNDYAAPLNYDYLNRPRRQEFDGYLVENGAFYITSRNALIANECRISGKIAMVEMPPETYTEIDEPEDWIIVEELLKRRLDSVNMPRIRMFLTDCDGTLTDGGMYYSANGEEMKKFNTRDGVGLRMLKEQRIIVGIITGEITEIVRKRADKLDIDELLMGESDKLAAILQLCSKYGVNIRNVAYIGDDLNDVEAIQNVGFGICVADAMAEAKAVADYITRTRGGDGAVREAAELILAKR